MTSRKRNHNIHLRKKLWSPNAAALHVSNAKSEQYGHVDALRLLSAVCLFSRRVCLLWLHNVFCFFFSPPKQFLLFAQATDLPIHVTCQPQPSSDHHGNGTEISPNPLWPLAITRWTVKCRRPTEGHALGTESVCGVRWCQWLTLEGKCEMVIYIQDQGAQH